MDSLTQITLGAAVGEIVLGKKVGNRAVLWGAVGGTIPDLDVVTGLFLTPLQDLAAHRGISHSIVFAFLGAILFGWIIDNIYRTKHHKYFAIIGWMFIPIGIVYFISRIFDNASMGIESSLSLASIIIVALFFLYRRYFIRGVTSPEVSLRDWQYLMFWALLTHPLLDCFTTYGTQIFLPFTDYRVAFNTVSVADLFYTIPFLICVILLLFYKKYNAIRRKLAWAGIVVSSTYLVFCLWNKQRVNSIWKDTLVSENIEYSRYMTSPSIMTNFLWNCLAETESGYYSGQYSIFDKEPKVVFEFIERNPDNVALPEHDQTLKCMKWFSNGYYNIESRPNGYQFNDLRFGSIRMEGAPRHYIFNFNVEQKDENFVMTGSEGGPPPGGEKQMMQMLLQRIKGI